MPSILPTSGSGHGLNPWVMVTFLALGAVIGLSQSSKPLPPAVEWQVDFQKDILPILKASCLGCHDADETQGEYLMTTRENAIGEGVIEVGHSDQSLLIDYVAHLELDYEMPPIGKGEKLTDEQIGILRAWIDQGLAYGPIDEVSFDFEMTPAIRFFEVQGNAAAFREHTWMRDGWNGGFQSFQWEQTDAQGRMFSGRGSVVGPYDLFDLETELRDPDLGFFRFGYQQSRSYDMAVGGYAPALSSPAPILDNDLYLDWRRLWIEMGIDRPEQWQWKLSYAYQERDGDKSMLHWGPVYDADFSQYNIYPAWKSIQTHQHRVGFELSREWEDTRLRNQSFLDIYQQSNGLYTADGVLPQANRPDSLSFRSDETEQWVGSNALSLERRLKPWWLVSGGYMVSTSRGDVTIGLGNVDPTQFSYLADPFFSRRIELENQSHVLNLNSLFGPWKNWVSYAGVQGEWSRRKAAGTPSIYGNPSHLWTHRDRFQIEENLGLRYTGWKKSVLYSDVRLQQERIGLNENAHIDDQWASTDDFMRETFANGRHLRAETGWTYYPARGWSIRPTWGFAQRSIDYDHVLDADLSEWPGNGYPAMLASRSTTGNDLGLQIGWKPLSWLQTRLTYRYDQQRYQSRLNGFIEESWNENGHQMLDRPPASLVAGQLRAHYLEGTLTWTPAARWFWSFTSSVTQSRMSTPLIDQQRLDAYEGSQFSQSTAWTYLINARTTFRSSYSWNHVDYEQNLPMGLPLGPRFDHHAFTAGLNHEVSEQSALGLQYGFYRYTDKFLNGAADYRAHGLFATWTLRFGGQ